VVDSSQADGTISLTVDGRPVDVADDGSSLLDVLRHELRVTSVKDGCSPQGQCGCCTVLVDGQPRVACVTPARRVAGREITTLDGLDAEAREAWADAFTATGASQCGFCTPGIVVRLEALRRKGRADRTSLDRALAAHLCRCTGWQTIEEAYHHRVGGVGGVAGVAGRDLAAAARRAAIEGRTPQHVGPAVALGRGGFADDSAPADALVAVPDGDGGWAVGETVAEARAAAGKVQGRRTTLAAEPPLPAPEGTWDLELRTSWVEPAYLETDASWCRPGEEPTTPLGNGGAFGGKEASVAPAAARELADRHGRAVRVCLAREDAVRLGAKRPPIAAGLHLGGTGVVRVARTAGIAERVHTMLPSVDVEEVDIPGPPTSTALRAAGWAEAAVLAAALEHRRSGGSTSAPVSVMTPEGGRATVAIDRSGSVTTVRVHVHCGDPLDHVVLRSYAIGAVHMGLSWVTSEALAVDEAGTVHDLTIRSFGVLPAAAMPAVDVVIEDALGADPVNGSDAVFAATAAAVWIDQGLPAAWPTRQPLA
jgi:aerobic-type carbon monoxide dehydrogenase small subunit (CoxS/CutS family)